MKITKSQLKEQVRLIVREVLNSEQNAAAIHGLQSHARPNYSDSTDDMITFFDDSGNPDKKSNKARQKELADQWQSEQDELK